MKRSAFIFFLLLYAAGSVYAQVKDDKSKDKEAEIKRKNEARRKWQKEKARKDSLDIASLPDSVKKKPMVLLKGKGFALDKWQVLDHIYYKDTSQVEYKRPSYPKEKGNTKTEEKPLDMFYIANCTSTVSKDSKAEVWFHKGGEKQGRWYKTELYYYSQPEILKVVPPEVLEKIKKELKEQADEDIRSLSVVHRSDSIETSEYSGDKYIVKPLTPKGYCVWGTKNGSNTNGSYFFTMDGVYIPVYEHDAAYNKKYKK